MRTSEENVQRKRIKLHFRLRWWWIGLLLLLLWRCWRFDNTIYDEQQLIPVTCTYQEIFSSGYPENVSYIIDSQRRRYQLDLHNLRPLKDAVKPGDDLNMKIEPSRSDYCLYDRRIAYLEVNGTVFCSVDDYITHKQGLVQQRHVINLLILVILIISLVGMFFSQNREIFYSIQRQRKRKKKRQQKEKRRLQKEALRLQQAEAEPLDPAQQRKLDKQRRQNKSQKHKKRRQR